MISKFIDKETGKVVETLGVDIYVRDSADEPWRIKSFETIEELTESYEDAQEEEEE